MENILLIDKPKGVTSYDVIRRLKNKYPSGTKIGHAGTLDPNATGLMIIGVGVGTKKLHSYLGQNKTYEAEILLGIQTDSGDITGAIVNKENVAEIDEKKLEQILEELVGPIRLPVSKFSAKKIGGKRSYKLARTGVDTPTILQDMDILSATLQNHHTENDFYILNIVFEVSSGTYIRSIVEEIGKQLDIPATLKNLKRTHVGDFDVKKCCVPARTRTWIERIEASCFIL